MKGTFVIVLMVMFTIALWITVVLTVLGIIAAILEFVWNHSIVDLFRLSAISFKQAIGLVLISALLGSAWHTLTGKK